MPSVSAKQSRTSSSKEIVDQQKHDQLMPKYLEVIEKLTKKYPVVRDESYEELVNFKTNKKQPIHNWFDYKQGYASALVERLIDYSKLKNSDYVFDPFTGVGTTQVVAQQKGFKSIGTDINPVASFAAKVKTHQYTASEIAEIKTILSSLPEKYVKTKNIPKYQRLNVIFTTEQLEQILRIKGFYESLNNQIVQDFFKLAYLSIIEPVSNRVKDGNGIKISKTKQPIKDVFKYYQDRCETMLSDIVQLDEQSTKGGQTSHAPVHPRASAKIIDGSLLDDGVFDDLKKYSIGSVIFSPPYANCFDYLEVYKMEVWLGGFVDDYDDFGKYRQAALRSHVNSSFSLEIKHDHQDVNIIAELISSYNIWNKKIPAMIRGYFDDMHEIINRSYKLSKSGSLCAIVVANSGYKGIIVPTDLILADIATLVGYKIDKIIHARNIRSSSQQTPELGPKNELVRESIILLRK